MSEPQDNASSIVERLLASYGVASQKALSERLDIPANNVSAWIQRESVPGNAIIKCALETGADLEWLMTGKLANANFNLPISSKQGKALLEQILASGGKNALRRILDAYGFRTQKELGDLLGISSGTISTWIRRDYFPGDAVITCALDTGVSLEWLATGQGIQASTKTMQAAGPKKHLNGGILEDSGSWESDISHIPYSFTDPGFVYSNSGSWIADFGITDISNGRWILDIDGKLDIYDVVLLPGKKINVLNKGTTFICGVDEVTAAGKIVVTLDYNF